MPDNPDELYSEWDYAEAAQKAEQREYPPHLDYECELCGESVSHVSDRGLCRWCEQIEGGRRD